MTSLRNLAVLKILESMRDPKLKLGMKSAVVQSDPIVRDLLKKGVKRKRNEIGNTKNLYKHTYLNAGKTKKNFLMLQESCLGPYQFKPEATLRR